MKNKSPLLFAVILFLFGCKKDNNNSTPIVILKPEISSISPFSGSIGTTVTVFGTGFTGVSEVIIEGITASTINVVNDTVITFNIPSGASSGRITLSNSSGSDTSSEIFTIISGQGNKLVAYSPAFLDSGLYPKLYTCDSTALSPPLYWRDAPAGTNSYALTMHTIPPTGADKVYLVLYDIGSNINGIPESNTSIGTFGANTFANPLKYDPPCSQGPGLKYYYFTVYALSQAPTFSVPQIQVTRDVLRAAISNITLDSAVITVGYSRP